MTELAELLPALERVIGDEKARLVLRRLDSASGDESPVHRSERFLAELGCETHDQRLREALAAGDDDGVWDVVRRIPWSSGELLGWADKLSTTRRYAGTRCNGGASRSTRLACCGVAFVAKRGDVIGWARRGCRDRLCPVCSALTSRARAAKVRAHCAALGLRDDGEVAIVGDDIVRARLFVTLTQPKYHYEAPKAALDRLFASWRRFRKCKLFQTKRHRAGAIVGGLRTIEVTARREGTIMGMHGTEHKVEVGGIHAHIHAIFELDRQDNIRDVTREIFAHWRRISGASAAALDVQLLTDSAIYQACKYACDFSGLADIADVAPDYVLQVLEALDHRRLCEPWGTWRGILREEPGELRYSDTSVAALVMAGGRVYWPSGHSEDAREVLAELAGSKPLAREEMLELDD